VLDKQRDLDDFDPPKYFQDIFDKFNLADEGFELKDVLVDPEVKEKFLAKIREKIEKDKRLTPLKKRELWTATRKSYSPVLFTALWGL